MTAATGKLPRRALTIAPATAKSARAAITAAHRSAAAADPIVHMALSADTTASPTSAHTAGVRSAAPDQPTSAMTANSALHEMTANAIWPLGKKPPCATIAPAAGSANAVISATAIKGCRTEGTGSKGLRRMIATLCHGRRGVLPHLDPVPQLAIVGNAARATPFSLISAAGRKDAQRIHGKVELHRGALLVGD